MAEHPDIDAATYHASPEISSGKIEDFIESRRLYQGRHITGTIPPKEPTPEMVLGTNVHLRILEPDRFYSLVAEPYPEFAPDGKKWLRRSGSDHEKWWADEVAKRDGKIALEQFELDRIEAIVESVLSKRWAARLLRGGGEAEYPIFWTDQETGLGLRVMVDWFDTICIDLKTTGDASPQEFARRCTQLGYHRKRAMYAAGIQALTGEDTPLLHIAVGTSPPYSAGAYELSDRGFDGVSLGFRQWRRALKQLAKCISENDFSDPWEKEIFTLQLPGYAFSQDQYQM